ncbi:histidine kinase [Clostridiaceae bacterium DONG20-135]|uniref:Histidine kinase n=1 Tax=Copranaerobaculum intestinale TaxID=2692629 RepID=A0A6N8U9D4_9FIRM|nr:histidine kinase [Copranaerobaculum intestinale]MXQ73934.1 histidine kinase [Copranaerobaculum intestinale]
MGLDQLLELTSAVASKCLPILGAILLVFLIIFFRRLIQLLVSAKQAADTADETLKITNRQLNALDKPLNTLNELSETVDNVHEMSKNVVRSTLVAIIENFSSIKNWVLRTAKQEDETKSCHPADEETGAE